MTPWRHHLRRARFAVMAAVAVLLIGAAVFVGMVQALLPLATHYPDFIARQLSARLHRPVKFSAISSQWQPSGPLLTVRNLTLGPGEPGGQSITLPHAALKFDFGAWLHPAHRWITLRLNDLELRLEHSQAGWQVAGFGTTGGQAHASLQSLPVNLDLRKLQVDIVDAVTGRSWQVLSPHLMVVNIGDTIRFGGSVRQLGTRQAAAINGRVDAARRDYDLHLSTRDMDLAEAVRGLDLHRYVVASGHGDFDIWSSWRDGKLDSAALRYDVRNLAGSGPDGRHVDLASLSGVFRARHVEGGWDIAWRGPGKARANIDDAGGAIVHLRGRGGAWRVSAAARSIDATPWLSLLAMAPQAPQPLVEWVAKAQPHAHIDAAALVWNGPGSYDATLRLSGLRAAAAGAVPGIALSRAVLRADPEAASVELPKQAATLAVTDVFRKPFVFRQFGGTLVAWREDGLWNIGAEDLHFDNGGFAGNGRAHLVWLGDGHRPFLSASGSLEHGKVADAKLFWPYRSMPASLIAWLDHAFVGGDVTAGRVLVRGNLDDWPFLHHEGRFEATGAVKDAEFEFADDWPRATGVDAALDFVNNRMGIVATHATVQGVTATHAVATIPDLGNGVLDLDVQGGGSGAQLLDFVRHSPVGKHAQDALQGLKVGGGGKFDIKLAIPLADAAAFSLGGKVTLAHADVTADKWKLALKGLGGAFSINRTGFRAQDLAATFRGAPARLSIAVGEGNVADAADIVEASMDTRVSAQTLVQGYPDLDSLVAHASGVAPFHIGVKVPAAAGGAPATPVLDVQSSLEGIALDLPAPLEKPAASILPLGLTLRLPPDGAPLTVSLGDVLQVHGRLADATRNLPTALAVNFGSVMPQAIPAEGLVAGGHAPRLDVSGWIQQAMGAESGTPMPQLARADVGTDDAEVFGTSLGALRFMYEAGAQDDAVGFEGPAVKGTLQLPTHDLMTRGITAHFAHLHWPEPPPPKQPAPEQPPPVTSPVAPMAVPPLHVTIDDLRLGNARLGAISFASAPTLAGMHISRFDAKGADFSIQAHGDWLGTRASSHSHFVTDISAHDFGKTLAAFGLSGLLAGGSDTHVHIDGSWPGAPSSFSLAWMTGTLDIKVGEGRLLAVRPGLGRLLGLLSLRELPSRLMLHFGDVFKSGFGFDKVSANFTLKDGSAFTRDMVITAPAAKIAMYGRTGFRARDFDLTVDVTPHVGGTLPVVGAVIGGPVGAAAGLVVQGLIGKGLNKAAGSIYRVTGSWDKPEIKTIATAPAPASTAPSPASTAPLAASTAALPASTAALPASTTPLPASTVPLPASTVLLPASTTPLPASTVPPPASTAPLPAPMESG